ncbi:thiol:disulfide interchange protein DsbA/DsbL [Shewanella avicenniae]|uniref:Thiol:disulfide interchange protein n=1 Tax=Shewanella avicenniae TaxID=2814294 RepID=A0ABX7QRR0_9GAMM|nr:thiol:disulfide interchange protein DsbA/DsbL [Shewanella avicenniae]QSX33383.1 thiol:disulfide interchange protein DsbA/DsbL [Shewanella avicenniae]
MRKLWMLAALLLLPLAANASEFREGVNYTVISSAPASVKQNATEFFSYYCPHCFVFSKKYIPQLKANLPAGMEFKQNHVEFIGREMGKVMSRAFAISEALGVTEKLEPLIFAEIHDKHRRFQSMEEVKQFYVENGVDAKKFEATAGSFVVNSMVDSMRRATENSGIQGVPAIIINDKYLIKNESLKSFEEMIELVGFLNKLP